MKKVIILFGPTGVGKTKLSIELAKEIGGEIISADSMQIYKGMDKGTSKILEIEKQGIQHHLLDIISPNEKFSVEQYVDMANKIIDEILSRKNVPIIVGGTGLYIKALINDYDFSCTEKNDAIREKYQKLSEEKGVQFVYDILKNEDEKRASQLHPNDLKRVIRALEIIEINKLKEENKLNIENKGEKSVKKENKYDFIIFGLNLPREKLYENINMRAKKMFDDGLILEVKGLLESGVKKEDQAMQGIGYKEIIENIEKDYDQNKTLEIVQRRSRNYAKRQLTFMRGIKNLIWIDNDENALNKILGEIKWSK